MRIFFPHECRRDADGWNEWIYNGGERFPRTSTRPPRTYTRPARNIHFARYVRCNTGRKIKVLPRELQLSPTGCPSSFVDLLFRIIPIALPRSSPRYRASTTRARIASNWACIARARLNSFAGRERKLFRNFSASQIRNCEIKREGVRQQ